MVRPAPHPKKKKKSRRKKSLDYKPEVLGRQACRHWGHICLFGLNLSPELIQEQIGGDGSPDCLLTCGKNKVPIALRRKQGQ